MRFYTRVKLMLLPFPIIIIIVIVIIDIILTKFIFHLTLDLIIAINFYCTVYTSIREYKNLNKSNQGQFSRNFKY